MKILKKLTVLALGTALILQTVAVSAASNVNWTQIFDGVWECRTWVDLGDGKAKAVVVKADLSDKNLSLDTLISSSSIHSLDTVEELANDSGAVVALNADFFGYGNSGGATAVGYNVKDSVLLSTPSVDEELASFAIDQNGDYYFDYFKSDITVKTETVEDKVRYINRFNDYSQLCIFTPAWGKNSPGNAAGGTGFEVVVSNGKIKEIRTGMEKTEIPEDGYVICGLSDWSDTFYNNIKEGDKIELSVNITPEIDAETVIGGGTLLVKNGKAAEITHNIKGRQPRSAFGMDKSEKNAYFVAVDGRGVNSSVGMTLAELQEFMIEIGVYNGINFDGGGSTQLVVNYNGDNQVTNAPSQHPYRNVINALGIVAKNTDTTVYTSRYDFENANGRKYAYPEEVMTDYSLTESKVTTGHKSGRLWYDFHDLTLNEPDGQSEGNAEKTGETAAETKKTEEDKEKEELIKKLNETTKMAGVIFKEPLEIQQVRAEVSLDVYGFEECRQWLRGMVVDANGDVFRLTFENSIDWNGWKRVSATVPDEVELPAKLTKIYVVQPSVDVKSGGELFFDNLTILQNKNNKKDEKPVVKPDEEDKSEEKPGTSTKPEIEVETKPDAEQKKAVAISAGVIDNNTLLSRIAAKKLSDAMSEYETVYMISEIEERFCKKIYGKTFISFGNIKDADISDDAMYFEKQLESVSDKNITVLIGGEITAPYKSMIKDIASENGKKVTVIYATDKHSEFVENSVNYIGVAYCRPDLTVDFEYIEMITNESGMFKSENIILWEK